MAKQKDKDKGMQTGSVYYGDCLKHLKDWTEENFERIKPAKILADLIYLDPPWNSNAKYNILWDKGKNKDKGHTAQEVAFTDIWEWGDAAANRVKLLCEDFIHPRGPLAPLLKVRQCMKGLRDIIGEEGMLAYLSYMAERLVFCRELLKETGSIYLHCDPYASHYLKMVMDNIFGHQNFRNEIVWDYGKISNAAAKKFLRGHDIILFYERNIKKSLFHRQFEAELSTRKKQLVEIGYNTKNMNGQRYLYIYDESKVEARVKQGKINMQTFDIVRKVDTNKGNAITDVWEIDHLNSQSKEYQGYPTQKPIALLKRIIQASSEEGDIVLDPFCGCGTAVVAAQMLKRKFIGVDISLFSVQTVTRDRMIETGLEREKVRITGIPEDLASARQLAKEDPFEFETFAVELCHPGFVANKVQRKDGGIDGRGYLLSPVKEDGEEKDLVIVQVKAGKPNIDQVRAFDHKIARMRGAIAGVFITLEKEHWTREMRVVANQAGKFKHPHSATKYPRLQHWHIKKGRPQSEGRNDV